MSGSFPVNTERLPDGGNYVKEKNESGRNLTDCGRRG